MLKTRKRNDNTMPRAESVVMVKNRPMDITFGTIFSVIESAGGCPPESSSR